MPRSKAERNRKGSGSGGSTITLGSQTHVGMVRSANQDSYCAILAPNAPSGTDALLAVADGMGGHQAGEVASAMAIQGLVRDLPGKGSTDAAPTPSNGWPALLGELVQRLNAEIFQAGKKPETQGMGTTLTIAFLTGTSLAVAHVGDSRLYLLRDGRLQQVSKDHSWVAEEVARGALTPEEAQVHPRRNILTRAMGTAPTLQVDTLEVQVQEGDTLMLCSDGLHGLVSDEEITQVLAREVPSVASKTLVDRANSLGGTDNVTVVVARIGLDSGGGAASREDAKTVRIKARPDRRPKRSAWRLLLRAVLLPALLLLWLLKLLGRLLRLLLRLLLRR